MLYQYSEDDILGLVTNPKAHAGPFIPYKIIHGDAEASVLSELIRQRQICRAKGAEIQLGSKFFFSHYAQNIYMNCGIKPRTQTTALRELVKKGLLIVQARGLPSRNYFHLNMKEIANYYLYVATEVQKLFKEARKQNRQRQLRESIDSQEQDVADTVQQNLPILHDDEISTHANVAGQDRQNLLPFFSSSLPLSSSSSSLRSEDFEERGAAPLLDSQRTDLARSDSTADQALEHKKEVLPVENNSQAEAEEFVVRLRRVKPEASPVLTKAQELRQKAKALEYDLPDPAKKNIAVSSRAQSAIEYWNKATLNGQGLSKLTCPAKGQAQTAKFKRCVKLLDGFFKGTTFAQYKNGITHKLTVDDFEQGVDRFLQVVYNPDVSSGTNKKEFLLGHRDLELFLTTPEQTKAWHKEPFFLQYGTKDPAPVSIDLVKDKAVFEKLLSEYKQGMGIRNRDLSAIELKHLSSLADVLTRTYAENAFNREVQSAVALAYKFMSHALGRDDLAKQHEFKENMQWCWSKPSIQKFLRYLGDCGVWRGLRTGANKPLAKTATPTVAEEQREKRARAVQAAKANILRDDDTPGREKSRNLADRGYNPEYDDARLADQISDDD